MSETKPTGEQIRFRSANTGDHVLDTYLESAEIGGRTLTDLLDDLFDPSNNGVFRSDNFEFRFDSNKIQFRVGQFASSTAGFTDVTTFFAIKGTFSTSTAYNNFDVVTTSDKDVYIVHGLSTATTYSSESNFISSANTTKIVDVSEAKDWAIKTDGIVSSTGYSAKAWAIGGTGVDNQSSGGAAKDWATKTGGTVDGSDFSAKHYATTGNVATVSGAISNINAVAGNATNINTVAGISSDITSVAGNSSNINSAVSNASNINSAVSNATNINTVSGISSDITTVAGISSNVTTVAGANSNISALNASGVITNIGTVATGISNVNTLAAISSDLTSLANSLEKTYIVTVANVGGVNVFVLDGVNNPAIEMFRGNTYIFDVSNSSVAGHPLAFKDGSGNSWTSGVTVTGTAGQSSAKVLFEVPTNAPSSMRYYCTVHGNAMGNSITVKDSNVSLVAGSIAGVNSVASSIANVNTVSGITANLATVAGISSAVSTVSSSNSNVTAVSGAITNINTVAGGLTNVNTVATNISSVNNFADVYRIASSAPTASLNAGDLYFDTSTNTLKVYGASGWQNAGSSVNGTSDRFHYDISGTPNSVTGSDANGNTLAYDAGFIDVYVNGVRMSQQDVTISSGDTVTFADNLAAGDEVDIVAFGTFSVSSLNATNLSSGTVPIARLGSGTKNNTTFLRGDNTFATIDLSTLSPIAGSSSIVTTGALNSGSITSGFGTIDTGSSAISTTGAITGGSLVADNITIDGTEIDLSSGDLTLDVAGDIILDADGGDVAFRDGGVGHLQISNVSNDVKILSLQTDKDLIFSGIDGGSEIEAMRIDMSAGGNVGIGTNSPSALIHGNGSSVSALLLTTNSYTSGTEFKVQGDGASYIYNKQNAMLRFGTNNLERVRITSSGNLLIGKTSTSSTVAGTFIQSSGGLDVTRSGNRVMLLNRLSNSGSLIEFQKADGAVGNIQERFGNIQVGTGETSLLFNNASNEIAPSGSSGGTRDNTTDLGANNRRWKNVWVGGNIYLGGTGSANQFSHYEEGTFNITESTSGYAIAAQGGKYTRIGDTVHCQFTLTFSNVASSSNSTITLTSSLPFTSGSFQSTGTVRESSNTGVIYVVNVPPSSNNFTMSSMDGVGSGNQRVILANENYVGSFTYKV